MTGTHSDPESSVEAQPLLQNSSARADNGTGRSPARRSLKVWLIALLVSILAGAFLLTVHRPFGHGRPERQPPPDAEVTLSECVGPEDWKESPAPPTLTSVGNDYTGGMPERAAERFTPEWWPHDDSAHSNFTQRFRRNGWMESLNAPSKYPRASWTSFELSLSDSLYLISRGEFGKGTVYVETSPTQDPASATVFVTAKYDETETRDAVKVCRASRGQGESGVGIFGPKSLKWSWADMDLLFVVHVILPRSTEPVLVESLETDMPNFNHLVETRAMARFGTLMLQSSNAWVDAIALATESLIIETSNGEIFGLLTSMGHIELRNSGADISAIAMVSNADALKSNKVKMFTRNGGIGALISLLNISLITAPRERNDDAHTGPSLNGMDVTRTESTFTRREYDLDFETTDGELDVRILAAPPDAVIALKGSAMNADARMEMDPIFQGPFKIWTSKGHPALVVKDQSEPDPSGRGRKRVVESRKIGDGIINGEVKWTREGQDEFGVGSLEVQTTNGSATLVLCAKRCQIPW